ncbi:GNAT family N-acetyltransferase [Salibaculum sp.]|uniref:GNAT family N-acetyltransferase n=1 Tax=Salibaculum sp. TaxID=2855480 RepID=UPI002B4A8052|nr:GNAT family N-acetyltransferase [Salibaculum sp.]HKL69789.1 GNAT family N-acetyltransferase [Salibaculum sp.]
MVDYSFRPVTPADAPMFKAWLAQPHIAGWWRDGESEWALVAGDIENPAINLRIVHAGGIPFAFLQDYDAHHWPMPQYADLPAGARALDTFLGDPAFLGQGHAAGYIAARLRRLRRRHPVILTDPDPANTRAIAAYARAGFRPLKTVPGEDGDPVQVMIHP